MVRIDTGRKHQIRTHRNRRGCSFPTVFQAFTFRYEFMYLPSVSRCSLGLEGFLMPFTVADWGWNALFPGHVMPKRL